MTIRYLSYSLFLIINGYPAYGEGQSACQLPFIYKNVTYGTCTSVDDPDGQLWCSTRTDIHSNHITDNWMFCTSPPPCLTHPVGIHGTCVSIQNCPRLNNLRLRAAKQAQRQGSDIETLRLSVCSVKPTPTVCCEPLPSSVSDQSNDPTDTYDLPTGCGKVTLQNFIIGGEDSGWWPWIVLLIANGHPFCGGTLIHERFVLTAAHCITPTFPFDTVRVGELIIGNDPDTWQQKTAPPVQEIKVVEIIKHPYYNTRGCLKCNDLAILRLEQPIQINDYVSPICLPLDPEKQIGVSTNNFEGEETTAAGWGVSNLEDYLNPHQPDHLQQVHLTINSTASFCQGRIRQHPPGSIFCAGSGDGKDTCRGDSGGPLMLDDANGLRSYLVGVTSHGPSICGARDTQGIYMNVHYYLPWIRKTMRNSFSTAKNTLDI